MPLSREQALALVQVMLKSPKVEAYLMGVLGFDGIPKIEDFSSQNERSINRSDDLIAHMEEVSGILRELQRVRGRQLEIDLSGQKALIGKFMISRSLADEPMGPFDTAEAAIEAAPERLKGIEPGDTFHVWQVKAVDFPDDLGLANAAICAAREQTQGLMFQGSADPWPTILESQEDTLETRLRNVVQDHLIDCGVWPMNQLVKVQEAKIPDPEDKPLGPDDFRCVACGKIASRADGLCDTKDGPECLKCYNGRMGDEPEPEEPREPRPPRRGRGASRLK